MPYIKSNSIEWVVGVLGALVCDCAHTCEHTDFY